MSNVKTYHVSTQGGLKLSPNFTVKEFACHDGSDQVLIDLDLVAILQAMRDQLGAPITITSGYRTLSHNAAVGGAANSFHTKGQAADIVVSGKATAEVAACAETAGALGVLRYITDGFVHVDTRTTQYYAIYTRNSQGVNVATAVSTHIGSPGGSAPSAQAIREIQSTLNERYNVGLDVDGIYGANTKIGLIKGLQTELNQQYDAGLVIDGYWGPKTKAACPIICEGSGNIQYLIQSGLYCIAGFTSLVVNGEFTADTINAVKAFQAAKNLTPVDGRTGPDTFAALFG